MKKNILKNNGVQSLLASLLCIVLGLLIGYIVLLFINPTGAGEAIMTVIKNFLTYNRADTQMKYFGNTLVKTAPLLMCALSILFAYKVGLFNIGASGQYTAGACAALYAALQWHWSWLPCMLLAIAAGCVLGAIVGLLKAYCNVNEVISRCKEKTSIICTSFVTQHYAYISIIGPRATRAQLRIAGNIAGNGTLSIPTNQNNFFCKMGRFCQKYFLFCIKNGTIKTPSLKREGNGNDRKPLIPAKESSGTVTSRAGGYAVRLAPHHIRLRKREK